MYEIKTFSINEIPARESVNEFGIISKSFLQIYLLYRLIGSQNVVCVINEDSHRVASFFDLADKSLFNRFGIYFSDDFINTGRKEIFLILPPACVLDVSTFRDFVKEQSILYSVDTFRYVIVEKAYHHLEESRDDSEVIYSELPNAIVLNKNFMKKKLKTSQEFRISSGVKYLNMFEKFSGKSINSNMFKKNLVHVSNIFESIAVECVGNVFLCCKDVEGMRVSASDNLFRGLLASFAAYLAVSRGVLSELPRGFYDEYFLAASKLVSQDYNYVSDYFGFVTNPIDCGFVGYKNNIFLCIKDVNVMRKKKEQYRVMADIISIGFDEVRKDIDYEKPEHALIDVARTKILKLEDVFDLTSDSWDTAVAGAMSLNSLFDRMEQHFLSNGFVVSIPLCVTNTFLFRWEDSVRIGVVLKLSGKIRYQVQSIDMRFKPFINEFSVGELSMIYDLHLAQDGRKYEQFVLTKNWVSGKNNHYILPKHARGAIFSITKSLAEGLDSSVSDSMTLSEVGLWLTTSSQLRGHASERLLKLVSLSRARKVNLLTCFGGPCPAIVSNIMLSVDGR